MVLNESLKSCASHKGDYEYAALLLLPILSCDR